MLMHGIIVFIGEVLTQSDLTGTVLIIIGCVVNELNVKKITGGKSFQSLRNNHHHNDTNKTFSNDLAAI